MKFETLVKRYKNIGYNPVNYEEEYLEIESIIKWLFDTHKIHVSVLYCTVKVKGHADKYHRFCGTVLYDTGSEYSNTFYSKKHFDSPYDAKFDALREHYSAIKFNI